MVCAGGEIQTVDSLFEKVFAGGVECAEPVDFLDAQLTVGFALAVVLSLESLFYALPYRFAFLAGCLLSHEFLLRYRRNFDLNIDTIQ